MFLQASVFLSVHGDGDTPVSDPKSSSGQGIPQSGAGTEAGISLALDHWPVAT